MSSPMDIIVILNSSLLHGGLFPNVETLYIVIMVLDSSPQLQCQGILTLRNCTMTAIACNIKKVFCSLQPQFKTMIVM